MPGHRVTVDRIGRLIEPGIGAVLCTIRDIWTSKGHLPRLPEDGPKTILGRGGLWDGKPTMKCPDEGGVGCGWMVVEGGSGDAYFLVVNSL